MTLFEINILGITLAPSFYGLMYVIGIFTGYYIVKSRKFIDDERLDSLLFYIFLGIIIGGRLGYVVFYNPGYYLDNPLEILQVWKGGMSFHGGVLGVIVTSIIFSIFNKVNFYKIVDEVAYVGTIGIFFGRIGNYFNKELLGFPYDGPLAVIKDGVGYFPAPLMEAILEGLILFIILSYFQANKRFHGQIGALFLILYAIFRMIVESGFRLPDAHIGMFFANMTLGSVLSGVMLIFGIFFYAYLWFTQKTIQEDKKENLSNKKHKK